MEDGRIRVLMLTDSNLVAEWARAGANWKKIDEGLRQSLKEFIGAWEKSIQKGMRMVMDELLHWIPREVNKLADALANLAMDVRDCRVWYSQGGLNECRDMDRKTLVVMTDAGIRATHKVRQEGVEVGVGMVILDADGMPPLIMWGATKN